jgi:hypothetical protein
MHNVTLQKFIILRILRMMTEIFPISFSSMLISHGLRSLHVLIVLWFIDCDDCGLFFPSSLAHQSMPEQSAKSLIYVRRFGVNRPMDLNALLFFAWMINEGCSCQSSTSIECSHLIDYHCTFTQLKRFVCCSPSFFAFYLLNLG